MNQPEKDLKRAAEDVKDTAKDLANDAKNAAQDGYKNAKEAVQDTVDAVKDKASDAADSVKDGVNAAKKAVKEGWEDATQGSNCLCAKGRDLCMEGSDKLRKSYDNAADCACRFVSEKPAAALVMAVAAGAVLAMLMGRRR